MLRDPVGAPSLRLGRDAASVRPLPDGRVVLIAMDRAGRRMVRTIEPDGTIEDRVLPSWLQPERSQ